MTVNEAIKAAESARALNLGGQYPDATCVLADEVNRLQGLLKLCLPAVLSAKQSERILNTKEQPFHQLALTLAEEIRKL